MHLGRRAAGPINGHDLEKPIPLSLSTHAATLMHCSHSLEACTLDHRLHGPSDTCVHTGPNTQPFKGQGDSREEECVAVVLVDICSPVSLAYPCTFMYLICVAHQWSAAAPILSKLLKYTDHMQPCPWRSMLSDV